MKRRKIIAVLMTVVMLFSVTGTFTNVLASGWIDQNNVSVLPYYNYSTGQNVYDVYVNGAWRMQILARGGNVYNSTTQTLLYSSNLGAEYVAIDSDLNTTIVNSYNHEALQYPHWFSSGDTPRSLSGYYVTGFNRDPNTNLMTGIWTTSGLLNTEYIVGNNNNLIYDGSSASKDPWISDNNYMSLEDYIDEYNLRGSWNSSGTTFTVKFNGNTYSYKYDSRSDALSYDSDILGKCESGKDDVALIVIEGKPYIAIVESDGDLRYAKLGSTTLKTFFRDATKFIWYNKDKSIAEGARVDGESCFFADGAYDSRDDDDFDEDSFEYFVDDHDIRGYWSGNTFIVKYDRSSYSYVYNSRYKTLSYDSETIGSFDGDKDNISITVKNDRPYLAFIDDDGDTQYAKLGSTSFKTFAYNTNRFIWYDEDNFISSGVRADGENQYFNN